VIQVILSLLHTPSTCMHTFCHLPPGKHAPSCVLIVCPQALADHSKSDGSESEGPDPGALHPNVSVVSWVKGIMTHVAKIRQPVALHSNESTRGLPA
jgi:hypothetical protein